MECTVRAKKNFFTRVEEALLGLKAGHSMVGVPEHLAADLANIEVESQEDFWNLLPQLLEELKVKGPAICYKGWRPKPEEAFEPLLKGLKLWAYAWDSKILGFRVYLKFCIKLNKDGHPTYLHARIHRDDPPQKNL